MELQHSQAVEQAKQQHLTQMEQMKQQHAAAMEQMKQDATITMAKQQMEFERWKAELDAEVKVVVAQMGADTTLKTSAMSINAAQEKEGLTELDDGGNEQPTSALAGLVDAINKNMANLLDIQVGMSQKSDEKHMALMQHLSRPRRAIRGPDGRIAGVE
jgi:membrane protein involved in colicin uptake